MFSYDSDDEYEELQVHLYLLRAKEYPSISNVDC